MEITLLAQQYNVGEKPTVICTLTLIAMQGQQKNSKNKTETMYSVCSSTPSNMVVIIYCCYIIGCNYKATTGTWYLTGFPNSNLGSTVSCRGEAHRYTGGTLLIVLFRFRLYAFIEAAALRSIVLRCTSSYRLLISF